MNQDHNANTAKYGMWESTSSMGMLKEGSFNIYNMAVNSWYMQLLHELLYTGSQTNILLSKDTIMLVLIDIIIVSPWNTSTLLIIYSFNNILKVSLVIWTWSTLFYVNLILHPFHFVIKQWLHMKLSYLLLERKWVLIYLMMNILQSLRSLIQSQIHHPVIKFQCRTRKCVDHCYQCRRYPHSSNHAWQIPVPSDQTWKI